MEARWSFTCFKRHAAFARRRIRATRRVRWEDGGSTARLTSIIVGVKVGRR